MYIFKLAWISSINVIAKLPITITENYYVAPALLIEGKSRV